MPSPHLVGLLSPWWQTGGGGGLRLQRYHDTVSVLLSLIRLDVRSHDINICFVGSRAKLLAEQASSHCVLTEYRRCASAACSQAEVDAVFEAAKKAQKVT